MMHLSTFLAIAAASSLFRATESAASKTHSSSNCSIKPPSSSHRRPIIIGHRGASYNLPEHTLEGYRLALELGADYIEPDLVPTKDGHLVAIHSLDLNITTNVEQLFPDRARDVVNQGDYPSKSGYFVHDFTLEEIKSLKVKQRVEDTPARSPRMDYMLTIPTFVEILDLLYDWIRNVLPVIERSELGQRQRRPGVYVELKNPSWIYNDTNGSIKVEDILLETITNYPHAQEMFFDPNQCATGNGNVYSVPPLVLQCFEAATLEYLRNKFEASEGVYHSVVPPTVFLVSSSRCLDSDFWSNLGSMAIDGIGPDKSCLLDTDYEEARDFMYQAKDHNLVVHPWTERLEIEFVSDKFNDAEEELQYLFCDLEVDGIFAENVGLARRVGDMECKPFKEGMKKSGVPAALSLLANPPNKWFVAVPSLIAGLFGGAFIALCVASRRTHIAASRMQLPTEDDDNELI